MMGSDHDGARPERRGGTGAARPFPSVALLPRVALHQYPLMSLHTAMDLALRAARAAAARGEVPVGAIVLAPDGTVLAAAGNEVEARHDASAHAELLALRAAAALRGQSRLPGCDLVVTLEPCPMCAQAISFFRIRRLIFGAYDPKGGGVEHGARVLEAASCHHRPEIIGGVRETEGAGLLKSFFTSRRVEPD
jgi:tRNA(adenine34) deaminase